MKSKTTTLLVLAAVILCLFSCGQPDSPAAGSDPIQNPPAGGKQPSALDSVVWQNTPYLLWNLESSEYPYSFSYTVSENGETGTNFQEDSSKFENFCFDDDDTLWYVCDFKLYKKESGGNSELINGNDVFIIDIDYDAASGRFYCAYEEDSSYNVKVIEKRDMKTASDFNVVGSTYSLVSDEDDYHITAASVDGNTYYAVFSDFRCTDFKLFAYTLASDSNVAAEKGSMSLSDNETLFGTYIENGFDQRTFSDIKAYAGNIYLLGSQLVYVENPWTLVSRGAVFMLTLTDSGFTLKSSAGFTPVTEIEKKFKDDDSENTFTITLSSNIPEKASSSSKLLSPQKFIAVKPKKLIIADRGVVWVSDTAGNSDVELQSRIATIDLESFTVSSEPYDGNFGNESPASGYSLEVRGSGCLKSLRVFDYD